jgi:hypothetical protein
MKFTHLRTEKVIISRMARVTGTNKIAMTTITSAYVNRQALDFEQSSMAGGVYGKTYVIYADVNADIVGGDKIIDENGTRWTVAKTGTTKYNMGNIEFLKVIITRTD